MEIPRIFEGQTCFVVAGGPSLRGFNFRRLDDRPVVAINRAHEFLPEADVLWWSDARYWRVAKESLLAHSAPFKATCQVDYQPSEKCAAVTEYQFTGPTGFDPDPAKLRHGNNSGFAAIHLAAHLGAARIVLLGLDMRHGADGSTHFHSGHGVPHLEVTLTSLMLPFFESLAEPLAERGIAVVNASPDSALTVWPRCTIDEGLSL